MTTLTSPDGATSGQLDLSRRAAAGVFFLGYAAAAFCAQADPIHTDDAGLVTETVTLPAPGFALPAYLARPKAPGRFPAVIVVSEVFGIHDYIKDVCRRLAKLGYVALAPAFFVRVADPAPLADMQAVMKIVSQASDPQVMGDVGAAIRLLQASRYVEPRSLAITGFCWGGGTTWLACEQFPELRAGVAWYGRMALPPGTPPNPDRFWPIDRVSQLTAPVLGLYGGKDALAAEVPAMRHALAAASKNDSQIVVYADAGHGFHADYRAGYNANDARDGWARMLTHFKRHGVGPKPFSGA